MEVRVQNECIVFLSGYIQTKPGMLADYSTRFSFIVSRFVSCDQHVEYYRVIVSEYDALRILQFSYIGAPVVIQGDLCVQNEIEILAKKVDLIDFLDPPIPGKATQCSTQEHVLEQALH